MKNMLKKIGVIGIIIAMLAPFVEIPVVKAAETQTCTDHTVMQYYFADLAGGDAWKHYTDDGYTTYTIYPYLFPEESGKEIKILNVKLLDMETGANTSSKNGITVSLFHSDVKYLQENDHQKSESSISGTYVTKDKSDYKVVKILHGLWGKEEDGSYHEVDWSNITDDADEFAKHTVQKVFGNNLNLTVSSARFLGTNKGNAFGAADENTLMEYFENLTSKDNDEYIQEVNGKKVFALRVNRQISLSTLKTKNYGYLCKDDKKNCDDGQDGKYAIFTSDNNAVIEDREIKDSYEIMKKSQATNGKYSTVKYVDTIDDGIDILTQDSYYWPAVLNVEYEVCTNTSEQWTLKYDKNTNGDDDSVTNFPSSRTENVGTAIPVDEKKPTRNGYVFKGWNTERDGSGDDYTGGQSFSSPKSADVKILYAQWGDSSKGDQKKTGVVSYVIGFISVGIVASGIYLIAKKKNLFKQI